MRRSTRIAAALLAFGLTAAACGSDADGDADDERSQSAEPNATDEPAGDAVAVDDMSDDELAEYLLGLSDEEFDAFTADLDDDDYNALLDLVDAGQDEPATEDSDPAMVSSASRDDVDCTQEGLGADDEFTFTSAHFVVDGTLGDLCLGDADDRLTQAWNALATIAPQGQLGDLGVFTDFEASEEGEEVTLAFVQPLDADGSLFQMSVNLDEYEADPQEALLTMAHEFSHVFTSIPSQTDRTVEAVDNCETYSNGESCFFEDSLVDQWVDAFWADYIDDFDPTVEATGAEGEERCAIDAGFLGSYAASTPEEDFAETFSAYVFDVPAATPEQQERIDWMADQPGLVEFRDRAEAAGLTPVRNGFEVCGVS